MKTTLHKSSVMKRIIPAIAIAATTMVACNTNPRVDSAYQQRAVPPIDTTGYAQFQAWKAQNELANTANYNANAPQQQPQTRTVVKYYPVRSSSGTASNSSGTARNRGWSSAAKGAVIGGVAGAAGGAVINKKNRAAGAVIGGVIGAAGGYGIGRSIDKKNGRY
jgi:hypothetical protein